MTDLNNLKKELYRDGQISNADVEKLRTYFLNEDGITRKKCNYLFEIKNTVNPEKLSESFITFFIDSITSYLLEDEKTPGQIDKEEAQWLRSKIQSGKPGDRINKRLLENIKEKSINFPEILNYKGKIWKTSESILYMSRFLTIPAIIGSIFGAVVLFLQGCLEISRGIVLFCKREVTHEEMFKTLVSSVDVYMFAMVLVIFGVGTYELFINKVDPVDQNNSRPSWLQISSIDDLKSSLGKVILMVLIVSFFSYSLEMNFETPADLLLLSIGIVLVSLSLYIANSHHKNRNKSDR